MGGGEVSAGVCVVCRHQQCHNVPLAGPAGTILHVWEGGSHPGSNLLQLTACCFSYCPQLLQRKVSLTLCLIVLWLRTGVSGS